MANHSDLTVYDFEVMVEELIDKACSSLSPNDFDTLLDTIDMILADYRS